MAHNIFSGRRGLLPQKSLSALSRAASSSRPINTQSKARPSTEHRIGAMSGRPAGDHGGPRTLSTALHDAPARTSSAIPSGPSNLPGPHPSHSALHEQPVLRTG